MAWYTFDGIVGVVGNEALCSECDSLIYFHIVAYDRCRSDDDSRAVVDDKTFSDGSTGMDVDTGGRVGKLGDHARDDGDFELLQTVGDAIADGCAESRVAGYDFVGGDGCGVAQIGSVDVGVEHAAEFGKTFDEGIGIGVCALVDFLDRGFAIVAVETESGCNLAGEEFMEFVTFEGHDSTHDRLSPVAFGEKSGKHESGGQLYDPAYLGV